MLLVDPRASAALNSPPQSPTIQSSPNSQPVHSPTHMAPLDKEPALTSPTTPVSMASLEHSPVTSTLAESG
ncbi:unnamed protein product [Rhodiola kirilowii]